MEPNRPSARLGAPLPVVVVTFGMFTLGCFCALEPPICSNNVSYRVAADDAGVVLGEDGSTGFLLDAEHGVLLDVVVETRRDVSSPEDDGFDKPYYVDVRLNLDGRWSSVEEGRLAVFAVSESYTGCPLAPVADQISSAWTIPAPDGFGTYPTSVDFRLGVRGSTRLMLAIEGDAVLEGESLSFEAEIEATNRCPIEGELDIDVTMVRILPDCLSDTGPADTGPADTGSADTGPADTGPADTGHGDTGPTDTSADTAPPDTGTPP